MRKILLATSALAALTVAGVASAQQVTTKAPFTVTLNGDIRYMVGYYNDKTANDSHVENGFDYRIGITAAAKAENGLEYGFYGRLRNDSADATYMDRKYIYLRGSWGTVRLGDMYGAASDTEVYVPDAGFLQDADVLSGSNTLVALGDYTVNFKDENHVGTKITYMSPVFSGFQAGVSYAPEATERGRNLLRNTVTTGGKDANGYEDEIQLGAMYKGSFDGIGLLAGAGYITASTMDSSLNDYRVWHVGAHVTYAGFTFGGHYFDNGESGSTKAAPVDTSHWGVGLNYAFGAWKIGGTYGHTYYDRKARGAKDWDTTIWSVGGTYQVAPGLAIQGDVLWFDSDAARSGAGNEGTLVAIRTQLKF